MVGIITNYRNVILDGKPLDFGLFGISLVATIILFIIGCWIAKKYGPTAADFV